MKKSESRGGWQMLLLAPILLLMVGCSSFSRDWRAALKQPIPQDLAGPWEGQWTSDVSGHNGRLRCLMTKKAGGEYDARFQAKYKKILSFSYTVPMKVRRTQNSWQLEGEADLGKMAGGLYTYQGAASATNFFSTYDNKYDRGKFEMSRSAPEQ